MKIIIIGAGGVGGYFGAKLAAAGFDTSFQQWPGHRRQYRDYAHRCRPGRRSTHLIRARACAV